MTQAKQETSTVRESQEWCRYLREKKGLVSTMPSEARNFAAIADHIATLTARNERLEAALKALVDAVGSSKVPQNTRDAALQLTVTLGPAYINASNTL